MKIPGLNKKTVRQRSALKGRERWEVAGLLRKPVLATRIQDFLNQVTGFQNVVANPMTGRILVLYDPNLISPGEPGRVIVLGLEQIIATEHPDAESWTESDLPGSKSSKLTDNQLWQVIKSAELDQGARYRALTMSGVATAFKLAAPLAFGLVIAVAVAGPLPFITKLGIKTGFGQLAGLAGTYFAMRAAEGVSEKKRQDAWSHYSQRIEQTLRLETFEHIQHLDMGYLSSQTTDKLVNLISMDTNTIKRFLEYTPSTLIDKGGTLLLGGGILAAVSPLGFLLVFVPLPIFYLINRGHQKNIAQKYETNSAMVDRFNQILGNDLQGLATIKSFAAEDREVARLTEASEQLYDNLIEIDQANSFFSSSASFAFSLGISLPLFYGAVAMAAGIMPFVKFMVVSTTAPILLTATTGIEHAHNNYQQALQAAGRLKQLMSVSSAVIDGEQSLDLDTVSGEVVFENVSFDYVGDPVVSDLSLTVPAGKTYAFVGATGSGKTTLTRLLLRFYDIKSGRILLDGHNIRDLKLRDLRAAVGLVGQDTYLFNGSIYENILYGRPEASHDEVVQAATLAEAMEFIDNLPEGFDTIIGERGAKLSGGQRQRISIARTMLKNPPILIFDEATSAVDNQTEAAIQASIERISAERTTFIIAHRLSTVRHADLINVLQDTTIVEQGTHEELLAGDGVYAGLWKLQMHDREQTS